MTRYILEEAIGEDEENNSRTSPYSFALAIENAAMLSLLSSAAPTSQSWPYTNHLRRIKKKNLAPHPLVLFHYHVLS